MLIVDDSLQSTDQGPPHNEDMTIKDVTSGSDTVCGNGWVCHLYLERKISYITGFCFSQRWKYMT